MAALGVVFLHFTEFGRYSTEGGIGRAVVDFAKFVDFFFVLSGFVIGLTAINNVQAPTQIFTFLRRRIARVYPMHVLTLLLFLAPVILGFSANTEKLDPRLVVEELFLVRYWQPHADLTLNFPSWSISVEWAMYLIFPALAWAYRRAGSKLLVVIALLAFAVMACTLAFDDDYHGLWFLVNSPVRALPTFTVGVILSRTYSKHPVKNGVWIGAGVFALVIVAMMYRANVYLEIFLFSLSIWLTAAGYASGDRTIFERYRIFEELGNASYSLYMLHIIFLIVFVQRLWPKVSEVQPPLWFGITVASIATLAAIVSFHAFERPARDWISSRRRKLSAVA